METMHSFDGVLIVITGIIRVLSQATRQDLKKAFISKQAETLLLMSMTNFDFKVWIILELHLHFLYDL